MERNPEGLSVLGYLITSTSTSMSMSRRDRPPEYMTTRRQDDRQNETTGPRATGRQMGRRGAGSGGQGAKSKEQRAKSKEQGARNGRSQYIGNTLGSEHR